MSFVECCFASSDVPRQVFGYNAECDQATLYLTTCCVNISCKHVSTSQKLIIIFARQTDLLVSYIYNCHHKYLKSRNTNDESWTVRTRRTNSSDFQLCRTLICHRTRSVSICQLIFVIMCIYFCDLLYFLYTDSSVQGMSTVSYSELMLMSFCFSFLLRCEARRVSVRLDKLAYPKPMYMRLCSRMLHIMTGLFPIMNVETADMATRRAVCLTLHFLVITCIYFCVIYCISCAPILVYKVCHLYDAVNLCWYVFCFSVLLPCEASWVFVRLSKLPYPRPCFMRRSAVGCSSVWDASKCGRSFAIMNVEKTANMATWGLVSLTLHSVVIICVYFVIYFISCAPILVYKICQPYTAVNLCW